MTQQSGFNLETCVRPNILALISYRCARDDYKGNSDNILLDANENSFGPSLPFECTDQLASAKSLPIDVLGLHRYPDPYQRELKQKLCELRNKHIHTSKDITCENLYTGVGSDEAIDTLIRCFCAPGREKILICPPTYGMYKVCAEVNDVGLVTVPLLPAPGFGIDVASILDKLSSPESSLIKIIFICSPGNPTGNLINKDDIKQILEQPTWNGIIVVDEAYIDFAPEVTSLAEWVAEWPNLVVIQTLSKAFGLAGIRLGAAFASPPVAATLNKVKAPYNISSPTSAFAVMSLHPAGLEIMKNNRKNILIQRERLLKELPLLRGIGRFRGGNDSNFLLVEILDSKGTPCNTAAQLVYRNLAENKGVVVRFRGKEHGCQGCLRITVGTEIEVTTFLREIKQSLDKIYVNSP
ncbi:hypothetical protein BGHDH14_bgh00140 [Blumeria hordei DH14]|uniref:histidinol-phosphate transaminase n=1 Tax=Blumeria graminis f. sp. hordei (strain DH14) TaxID=546991 RepID=N1JBS8_BLUG1|nr:hypothetical protein BGHDH14_bgh00140 [Blumeria hordei DH14]